MKVNDLVSRETERLKEYEKLILKWNMSYNLISNRDTSSIWPRHIYDSAQLIDYIEDLNVTVLDVGTGAGLPGVVLSILGVEHVILVEANQTKTAFLLQASKISANKIDIYNSRVEKLTIECDILCCRGFASLNQIFDYVKHVKIKQKILLLKGRNVFNEIKDAEKKWDFDYLSHPSKTNSEGIILEIKNLKKHL